MKPNSARTNTCAMVRPQRYGSLRSTRAGFVRSPLGSARVVCQSVDPVRLPLRRTRGQRRIALFAEVSYWMMPLGIIAVAIGPWTYFDVDPGNVRWLLVVLAVAAVVLCPRFAVTARRGASAAAGSIELAGDQLIIRDDSLFVAPLVIERPQVAHVSAPPPGRFAFRVGGPLARANGVLVSLFDERPNMILTVREPVSMATSRWNRGLSRGCRSPA